MFIVSIAVFNALLHANWVNGRCLISKLFCQDSRDISGLHVAAVWQDVLLVLQAVLRS